MIICLTNFANSRCKLFTNNPNVEVFSRKGQNLKNYLYSTKGKVVVLEIREVKHGAVMYNTFSH